MYPHIGRFFFQLQSHANTYLCCLFLLLCTQLLDINEMNSCTATWSLVLSHLPSLYQLCNDAHLRQVAEFILKAMLLSVKWEGDGTLEGTTVARVAVSALESESLWCMRRLQELLIDSCFSHAASSIPKW